jgi:TRAP-type transport system large permease protein
VLLMPVILLGGIYGGADTPTEAAAIAALYALILSGVLPATQPWRAVPVSFPTAPGRPRPWASSSAGADLQLHRRDGADPRPAVQLACRDLDVSKVVPARHQPLLLMHFGMPAGRDTIILVVLPLFIPACQALGIDLVHFGVFAVVNCMIGLITPPYGMLMFVINAVTGIPLRDIIVNILPFLFALLFALAGADAVPRPMSLWLPRQFGYSGMTLRAAEQTWRLGLIGGNITASRSPACISSAGLSVG